MTVFLDARKVKEDAEAFLEAAKVFDKAIGPVEIFLFAQLREHVSEAQKVLAGVLQQANQQVEQAEATEG